MYQPYSYHISTIYEPYIHMDFPTCSKPPTIAVAAVLRIPTAPRKRGTWPNPSPGARGPGAYTYDVHDGWRLMEVGEWWVNGG